MRKPILLLISLSFFCGLTNAQNTDPGEYSNRINMLFLKGYNYLKPLDTIQLTSSGSLNNEAFHHAYCQLSATYRSFIGDYAGALKDYNAMFPGRRPLPDTITKRRHALSGFQAADAATKIASLAAHHKVVMINEAHHIPYHRLFTKSLLQQLYKEGFRYLALETLTHQDEQLNSRKYAVQGDGFYSAEPLLGDLIRTAARLGFQVVSYEDTTECAGIDCAQRREIMQAQNLANLLKRDTAAKILVHAGYDHIMEKPRNGFKRMAMYFSELSGLNPLTINQEKLCEQDTTANENSYYIAAQQQFNFDCPSVLVQNDSIWVEPRFAGYFDVEVFHPRFRPAYGRPGYFKLDISRKPVKIKPGPEYKNTLVQAYFRGEEKDGIPVDQFLFNGKFPLYLMLPPGDFVVFFKDHHNKILSTRFYHQKP